jgi:hypothetical protein
MFVSGKFLDGKRGWEEEFERLENREQHGSANHGKASWKKEGDHDRRGVEVN